MSLVLHVDAERWRGHLKAHAVATPGLVPVVKGNGYGFGLARLAREAAGLTDTGLTDTLAVGSPEEVDAVEAHFAGELLVLAPWRADHPDLESAGDRLVRTVAHLDALETLRHRGSRVVVECLSSMRRHGIAPDEVAALRPLLDGQALEGFALHLPLVRPSGRSHVPEVTAWIERLRAAGLAVERLWLSHLSAGELAELRVRHPGLELRPRVGTALWLGERGALRVSATVLDVRPVARGDRFGYRQRRAERAGTLLVVSGGTAHGIGLEAPKAVTGVTGRVKLLGAAGLSAAGFALSPFRVAGRQRWYAEPPHMQVSMVLLPPDVRPPALGDDVDVEVRMTATSFDRISGLG